MSILNVFKKKKEEEQKAGPVLSKKGPGSKKDRRENGSSLSSGKKKEANVAGVESSKDSPSLIGKKEVNVGEKFTSGDNLKPVATQEKIAVGRQTQEVKVAPLVLRSAHVTEKATNLQKNNQYIFKVFPSANKSEVKKAVKEVYNVDVITVRMIKIPKKPRRLGRTRGWRKSYKKAIVQIKQGQTIELMPR